MLYHTMTTTQEYIHVPNKFTRKNTFKCIECHRRKEVLHIGKIYHICEGHANYTCKKCLYTLKEAKK